MIGYKLAISMPAASSIQSRRCAPQTCRYATSPRGLPAPQGRGLGRRAGNLGPESKSLCGALRMTFSGPRFSTTRTFSGTAVPADPARAEPSRPRSSPKPCNAGTPPAEWPDAPTLRGTSVCAVHLRPRNTRLGLPIFYKNLLKIYNRLIKQIG